MAGGPVGFSSAYPADASGRVFPFVYAGAGGNAAPHDEGLGVMASLDADATWELRFLLPPVLPTGTPKLRLLALANAAAGVVKLTVSDGVAAPAAAPGPTGNPSAATLTAEAQTTVTWTTGEADRYKETKVALTATPAASDVLVVALRFQAAGWTLAVASVWVPTLIWE
jgi:hypothetical protein